MSDARSSGVEDIQFFSDVDKKFEKKQEHLTASYPGWYFDQQLAEKKEELAQRKRKRASDEIGEIDPEYRAETKALETKIKEIEESKPKLNGAQTNFLKRAVSELEGNISSSMFDYDSMMTGEASPHSELERQMNPCIPIDGRLARALYMKPVKGKVSRDDATRAMQICNKLLGENSNSERLRPRGTTCRTQRITPFTGFDDSLEPIAMGQENGREATTQTTV